jgi:integrase
MGVVVRKKDGVWYVFVNRMGRRKAKRIGTDRKAAKQVKRALEAKLALGDLGLMEDTAANRPEFGIYADAWLKEYAQMECKASTANGYQGVLRQYLRPKFGLKRLDEINRQDVKSLISDLIAKDLSRSTIRNAVSVLRAILNQAIEDGLLDSNPAVNLGRFTRSAKATKIKGIALTPEEVDKFLSAAQEICPEYHPLFLVAVRAGLRRGELVDLRWGDIHFGRNDQDPNRFILVQHNYVRREHTTTKSRKQRLSAASEGRLDRIREGPDGALEHPGDGGHVWTSHSRC